MRISIVDYYTGNTMSLVNALNYLDHEPILSNKKEIKDSEIIILPGVGSFGRAMNNLKKLDLIEVIYKHIKDGKKLIGICLGMQLLFSRSSEIEMNAGLDLIKGEVSILKDGIDKIPNVGMKKTEWINNRDFEDSNEKKYYFTHSYVGNPMNKSEIITQFSHNQNTYCCGVNKDNIYGFQFHPELSSHDGIKLLKKVINRRS
tara:strand:+ start:162 stop:767 length:606 start_codon:yes stop_codon:yes gene_type:complete